MRDAVTDFVDIYKIISHTNTESAAIYVDDILLEALKREHWCLTVCQVRACIV